MQYRIFNLKESHSLSWNLCRYDASNRMLLNLDHLSYQQYKIKKFFTCGIRWFLLVSFSESCHNNCHLYCSLKWMRPFYFFLSLSFFKILFCFQREGKGRRKRGRETSMCGRLSTHPYWGTGLQCRRVPSLGIEPATLSFTGPRSIHWATPARVAFLFLVTKIFFRVNPSNFNLNICLL